MPKLKPQEDTAASAEAKTDKLAPATSRSVEEDAAVDIPLEDVTIPNYSDEVQKLVLERARLNAEALKALRSDEMKERLALDGAEPVGTTPAEFGALIKNELEKWTRVARSANIEPQ